MKNLSKVLILITLFTVAFSWTALFERLERLKEKEKEIEKNIDLKNLGLNHLKDFSLKDLAHFEAPDMKSKLEKLKHIIPKDLDPAHHHDVDEFWTGVYENFRLPKPVDLINCFGTVSGPMFFRKIRTVNDLLQHSKAQDNLKLHTDYVQMEVIMHALEHAHSCMVETKDFERLMDSLHCSHDANALKKIKYLYFQANYDKLADEFKPIMDEVDAKNFNKAGKLFADLFKKSVKDFKKTGEDVMAHQAFNNGVYGTLGLPLSKESAACYSSKDAKHSMDFVRGLAHAISEGRWYRADKSAAGYWEGEGKDLLGKISKKARNCEMNSSDMKKLGEKIGLDLSSEEFNDKMWDYVNDHNIMFYSYLRTMNAALERNDYLHAGSAYAHLLEAVAKTS